MPCLVCPVDKDYTDGEKAVRYAAEHGVRKAVVYGADGGRLDMQLANLSLLKIARDVGIEAEINSPSERVYYTDDILTLPCRVGKRVSVLPYGGNATFLSSTGLRYPLAGLTLTPSDTVGLSNATIDETFSLTLSEGGALVFVEK